jgi:hypothetical protein
MFWKLFQLTKEYKSIEATNKPKMRIRPESPSENRIRTQDKKGTGNGESKRRKLL